MSTAPKTNSAPQSDAAAAAPGDAELSKILGEVEALQQEMAVTRSQASVDAQEPAEDFVSDFGAPSSEGSLEDTLGGLEIEESVGGMLAEAQVESEPMNEVQGPPNSPATLAAVGPSESRSVQQVVGEEIEDPLMDEALKTINDEIGRLTGEPDSGGIQSQGGGESSGRASSVPEGSLKLTLRGQMSIQLEFEASGQGVVVATEDGKLIVRLSNGAEFRIPLDATPARLRRIA